jgi:hypothetical protein
MLCHAAGKISKFAVSYNLKKIGGICITVFDM